MPQSTRTRRSPAVTRNWEPVTQPAAPRNWMLMLKGSSVLSGCGREGESFDHAVVHRAEEQAGDSAGRQCRRIDAPADESGRATVRRADAVAQERLVADRHERALEPDPAGRFSVRGH